MSFSASAVRPRRVASEAFKSASAAANAPRIAGNFVANAASSAVASSCCVPNVSRRACEADPLRRTANCSAMSSLSCVANALLTKIASAISVV